MDNLEFFPVPNICQLVWKDSHSLEDVWHDSSYCSSVRVLSSAGFLVSEDDEYITIAATYDQVTGTFGNAIAVLQCCVLSKKIYTT